MIKNHGDLITALPVLEVVPVSKDSHLKLQQPIIIIIVEIKSPNCVGFSHSNDITLEGKDKFK